MMAQPFQKPHIKGVRREYSGRSDILSSPLLVAIVDDDPGVSGSIASLLRSAGLESERFLDGSALLERDALADFACVITDLHMAGVDGRELQAELKRRAWKGPLIVITAFPTEAAREQIIAAGAHAFLTKPIDPDGLLEVVEAAIC